MSKTIYASDCETDPFKFGRIPEPFAWGLKCEDGDYTYFWGANCTEQFIEYCQDIGDAIFYFHNGGKFDIFFLLPYLDPDVFIINGRIAKATMNNGAIELRDSWLILPLALAAHDKGEIDYIKMERENRETNKLEILRYLQRDCESLLEWVLNFRNQFGGGLTLAGSAFKQLRKTGYPVENTSEYFDNKMRPFYYGGRVQCFEVGAFKEPLEYYDIQSAYPYAMTFKHWQGGAFRETVRLPEHDNGSWFAEIDAVSYGALPYKHVEKNQPKLYFPDDGKLRTYRAAGWEIMAGLDTDTLKIKKVRRVFRPTFTADFCEYVDKFFTMKNDAEKAGDKTLRQFAKLMLNSCYGKFGQDGRDFEKFMICEWGEVPAPYEIQTNVNGTIITSMEKWNHYADTETLQTIYSRPDPVNRFYNVATAASVTGFVRAYLWRAICASDGVLYCDTDSIICRSFNGDTGKRIGQWALECNITEAYIAQRKMYAVMTDTGETKVASKGVRLTFDDIKTGVLTGKNLTTEKEAPAFSLKYGARFFDRTVDFKNIQKNACNNPPGIDNRKAG